MLDYKLIEAFAAVINKGGFERAGKDLGLTQSAVSQRIKNLEEQYGQVLLQRTSPPEPTEAGSTLLGHYNQVQQLESDLLLKKSNRSGEFTSLSIGLNADSLATWFPSAVRKLLESKNFVLDLHVDDQDNTHELLLKGEVWGCISSRENTFQGCKTSYLGSMLYNAYCTPAFRDKWFKNGFSLENCCKAPMARFNRKDELNKRLFLGRFGEEPPGPPTYYIPSTEKYAEFILNNHCYGIIPVMQAESLEEENKLLINLAPENNIEVPLYWHCWTLKSEQMQQFDSVLQKEAAAVLK